MRPSYNSDYHNTGNYDVGIFHHSYFILFCYYFLDSPKAEACQGGFLKSKNVECMCVIRKENIGKQKTKKKGYIQKEMPTVVNIYIWLDGDGELLDSGIA